MRASTPPPDSFAKYDPFDSPVYINEKDDEYRYNFDVFISRKIPVDRGLSGHIRKIEPPLIHAIPMTWDWDRGGRLGCLFLSVLI